jgi:glucuronate isomerase
MTGEDTRIFPGYLRARKNAHAVQATPLHRNGPRPSHRPHRKPFARWSREALRPGPFRARQAEDQELFRAQMLTEMAGMSVKDGLVMQIHPGSVRNHNRQVFEHYGRDMGADIPTATDYVHALRPLLDRYGNEPNFTLILFTLDESAYSRELAPLAGQYPCLRLGPPWWFYDNPEGMQRFREYVTATAGFYNTAGFNDDTRAPRASRRSSPHGLRLPREARRRTPPRRGRRL